MEDAGGFREWADGLPGSALRGRVRAYTGFREELLSPVRRRETPSGECIVIVSFGDGSRALPTPGAQVLKTYSSFIAGIHDRPTRTGHDGRQLGIQIRLDPLGAFSLFGVPMHELGNRVVALSDLLGSDSERWAGGLSEAKTWKERFALLDCLLTGRIAAARFRRQRSCGRGGRCAGPAGRSESLTLPRVPDAVIGTWQPGSVSRSGRLRRSRHECCGMSEPRGCSLAETWRRRRWRLCAAMRINRT